MRMSQIIAQGRMTELRQSDFPLVVDVPLVARCGCDPSECEAEGCLHVGYLVHLEDTAYNRANYPVRQS